MQKNVDLTYVFLMSFKNKLKQIKHSPSLQRLSEFMLH